MSMNPVTNAGEFVRSTTKDIRQLKRRVPKNWQPDLDAATLAARNRNRIINGDCAVNQRNYVSGNPIIPGTYSVDRWRASGRVNLIPNPSFEVNITGYVSNTVGLTASRVATPPGIPGVPGGSAFMRATATVTTAIGTGIIGTGTAASEAAVLPNTTYTLSLWVRSSKIQRVMLEASWLTAAQVDIATPAAPQIVLAANVWTRLSYTGVTPANAAFVRMGSYSVAGTGAATWAIGDTYDLDCFMVTQGSDLLDYFDGASTGASWSGTANASPSYSVPVVPTLTFTALPQGQMMTLNTGATVSTVLERADIPAGTYVLGWDGTASMRVYNLGSTPPAFARGPIVVDLDGLADVVVEAQAIGAAQTFGFVQLEFGGVPTPFEVIHLAEKLAMCKRYCRVYTASNAGQRYAMGYQVSTVLAEVFFYLDVTLRVPPIVTFQNIWITDGVVFNGAISGWQFVNTFPPQGGVLNFYFNFAVNGAISRPIAVAAASLPSFIMFEAEF